MADRTVKVRLELDDDAFKGGLEGDAAAVRGFDGEVRTLGDHAARTGVEMKAAGNDIQAAGEEIKAVGRAAVPSTDQVRKLGDEAKNTGEKVVSAGSRLDTLTTALHNVDEEIARSKTLLGELAQEFGRTGDTSLVSKFSGENSALSGLVKFRGELEKLKADAEQAAKSAGGIGSNAQGGLLNFALDEWVAKLAQATKLGVQNGLNSISGTAPAGLVQWLVAGGAAAAPAILAAIDGAILAGVGTIGIGAAIALQAHDPAITAAYRGLGTQIMSDLMDATASFKGPLLALADDFRQQWAGILPGLKADWDALAPVVERFGQGVGGLVTHTMPGFNAAMAASVPVINMLSQELPHIGDALSSMFSSIAAGGEGGKQALQDLLIVTEGLIITLGRLTEIGSKAFAWLDKANMLGVLAPLMDHMSASTDKTKQSLAELNAEGYKAQQALGEVGQSAQTATLGITLAGDDFKNLSQQISMTATTSDMLAGAMSDKLFGAMMSQDRATLAVATSLTALSDAFKQNGLAIDKHTGQIATNTAKGEANRSAILNVVAANVAQYDAQIKAGISAQDAAAAYDQNTGALVKQMRQAGLTQGQIDGLIGKYRSVPANVDTDIELHGLAQAINDLNTTLRLINGLPSQKTITVTTYFNSVGSPAAGAPGGLKSVPRAFRYGGVVEHAADGLLREAQTFTAASTGARYAFAEPQTQGEAFIPKNGDLARSRSIWGYVGANWLGMKGAGGSAKMTSVNITVNAGMGTDGTAVGRQIAAALKPYINDAGGGNVQNALGRRGQ